MLSRSQFGGLVEDLGVVVIQLEEAKRLLLKSRPEYHRLALILLDNAAELQLLRATRGWVSRDEMMDRIGSRVRDHTAEDLPETLRELARRKPMTQERKAKLQRFFGEKVDYLALEKGDVAPDIAEVLHYLHRSRNRVYHDGDLERHIAKALGILLLELNCRLLETLPLDMLSWVSNRDYSWLTRYGVESGFFLDRERDMGVITGRLRRGVPDTVSSVRDPLISECERRLAKVDDALVFISENDPAADDRKSPLKAAQYYRHVMAGAEHWSLAGFRGFRPRYGVRLLNRCRSRVAALRDATTTMEGFREFAKLIEDVEMIEADVFALAAEVDAYVQGEVDRALGK